MTYMPSSLYLKKLKEESDARIVTPSEDKIKKNCDILKDINRSLDDILKDFQDFKKDIKEIQELVRKKEERDMNKWLTWG